VLQKAPTDLVIGPCFGLPVPNFDTGVMNASASTLQDFVQTQINDMGDIPEAPGELSNYSFIFLDSRSAEYGTC